MSEFKAGDKAILTIEVEVVNGLDDDGDIQVTNVPGAIVSAYVKPEHLTKIKPALPSKIGAVIRDEGGDLWFFAGMHWINSRGDLLTRGKFADFDFEVLSEGIDA